MNPEERQLVPRKLRGLLRPLKRFLPPSFPVYLPYMPGANSYVLSKSRDQASSESSYPVPPKETWISEKYGQTDEEYLASGKRDVQEMLEILERAGVSIDGLGHILEFGCGDGRMLRWLEPLARDCEIWGTDIHAGRIFWCKQNLSPSLRFITTTTVPHLPFEDRHFGFVFAGSVFTHIDDLADAWWAELRRILRVGGKLFVNVHLRSDLTLLNGKYRDSDLAKCWHSRQSLFSTLLGFQRGPFLSWRSSVQVSAGLVAPTRAPLARGPVARLALAKGVWTIPPRSLGMRKASTFCLRRIPLESS